MTWDREKLLDNRVSGGRRLGKCDARAGSLVHSSARFIYSSASIASTVVHLARQQVVFVDAILDSQMSPVSDSPWPLQTPAPPPPPKRRRLAPRQSTFFDQIERAQQQCQLSSGNDVISCFPTNETIYAQNQWAAFVWNSRLPEFTQFGKVNAYLFDGDSRKQVLAVRNLVNPTNQAGTLTVLVNDTWWGPSGALWSGSNMSHSFYWVVKRADQELTGSEFTQAHFVAVQTTYADSIIASMSTASFASSLSAASASAASASRASVSSHLTANPTANPTAGSNIQNSGGSSSFPKWAIAVIVILGFVAIATTCLLIFFIMRRLRRRREMDSKRNSMGSASPMMAHANNEPQSPLLASHTDHRDFQSSVGHGNPVAPAAMGTAAGVALNRAPSLVSPDGASTISRAGSAGEGGPFSGADAAIMADAFRKALRKPDFAGRPVEEGDSPENPEAKSELLSRELAEEGRDIRSVSSSRGVRVETLSDSGDTAHDIYR
ncbi:hypothetical protein E1B28_012275 [Marasmius oreades]|uniref:Uncharacterized protein n=1 Tax=Marasmius oreades TaxID=181124 RepID=A0A9P7UPR6_9AGAR|nr:uncharacterized protein E1B28_012275 [Marasmius oreades]KAG7088261.1 hypothetical protein E1B28_012275 [Marasmius oreades]